MKLLAPLMVFWMVVMLESSTTPAAEVASAIQPGQLLPGLTERVSQGMNGQEANGPSEYTNISADGRYVVFHSLANNLVNNDGNGSRDVFLYDRQTGTTTRISVDAAGNDDSGDSTFPDISSDGRYVAFHSLADELVAGDDNGYLDVFVRDRQTNTIERVSVHSKGSEGNEVSIFPDISADGRYVSFYSLADNLVNDDSNETWDIFVHDRQTNITRRVSVNSLGQEAEQGGTFPEISGNGRYTVFISISEDLVDGDDNEAQDVFVHDQVSGQTIRVSVNSQGQEGNGESSYATLSADGRFTTFSSAASNLVGGDQVGWEDIFVHDRQTGLVQRATIGLNGAEANGSSYYPFISADGRFVGFHSEASNLVAGDGNGARDVFVYDRVTGITERISVNTAGQGGVGDSSDVSLSADGCFAVFHSAASLVGGDGNNVSDIYLRSRCPFDYLTPTIYFPAVFAD